RKSAKLDARIHKEFGPTHAAASRGELHGWRAQPSGRLAEIIVLDQFSRNIHRDTPNAFAQDETALILAQEAVLAGVDGKLDTQQRAFVYMPFTHRESDVILAWAPELLSQTRLE